MNRTKILLVATTVAFASGIGFAQAKSSKEDDAMAVNEAKVAISQAIAAAEQHVQGKASRAELERTRRGLVYEIEVVKNDKAFDVRIDASKGSVLSSVADKDDRGREDVDTDDQHGEHEAD